MQFLDLHFSLQISTTLNSVKTDIKVVLSKYAELKLLVPRSRELRISGSGVAASVQSASSLGGSCHLESSLQAALHSLLPLGC